MKKTLLILIFLMLAVLIAPQAAFAGDVTPGYLYRSQTDPDIPPVLYVGYTKDCGNFSIRVLQQPVLNKSTNYMVADNETRYMTVRVAITNKSSEPAGWLAPDSFTLQDTYLGRIYATYKLDLTISAKTAEGFKEDVFFSEIKPGGVLFTTLVFEVYPEAQSYILTFAPRSFSDEAPAETVRFTLPRAIMLQDE